MTHSYISKARNLEVEFFYDFVKGDYHTPDYRSIWITSVTRVGVSVIDLIDVKEIETEIQENINDIIS